MFEDLKTQLMEIGAMCDARDAAVRSIEEKMAERRKMLRAGIMKFLDHAQLGHLGIETSDIRFSDQFGWACKHSPTGACIYDDGSENADICLICDNPEERK